MKRVANIVRVVKCFFNYLAFTHGVPGVCILTFLICATPTTADSRETAAFWNINGFIELESFLNTYSDQDFKDAAKKNEIHGRLESKCGLDNFYLYIKSDLYLLPDFMNEKQPYDYRYAPEDTVARNLRISGERYDLAFNELYINLLISPLRFRLGNQIYSWGTADVFNPTAYFNPHDLREFLFRDDDELKQGVPSFSAIYFSDYFTTEFVFSFPHVPMEFAPEGNFWSVGMNRSLYSIIIEQSEGMEATMRNAGVGARISTSLLSADISLSGYYGPDRESVQRPVSIDYAPNAPLALNVEQYYNMVTMVGIDFSRAAGNFVFQVECAYSPDKPNIVMQEMGTLEEIQLPFEIEKSDYLSYAAGFNYFIPLSDFFESHTGETVFTLDWFQSHFFDKKLADPSLSDILTLRLQDSYFDDRLNIKMTAMFETRHAGAAYWPEIQYDFMNGWRLGLSYAAINGNIDGESIEPLFYHFRDNDIAMLKLRYEF